MQKMPLWIVVLFLFSSVLCEQIISPHSTENYISKPLKFEEIRQTELLNSCHIKIAEEALYMCKDAFYIFKKDSSNAYSILSRKEHSVIDADIYSQDVVYINSSKLMLLPNDSGQQHDHFVEIVNENPIFVRIQENNVYDTLIIISQTKQDALADELTKTEFVIHNFLLGGAPHFHHTKFPTENLRQNLTINDFKEAMVFTDLILGHDYLIIALKDGLIYFFRSLFEDPKFELITTEQMDQGNQIKSITNRGNFLFVVLGNNNDKKLSLKILRMVTPNGFSLITECDIDIPRDLEDRIEIKVKEVKNTFLIMINFPGSILLVYNFQKSAQGIYKLKCPGEPEVIDYAETGLPAKIGYSFAYLFQAENIGSNKQGILFSPFSAHSSYFLPLCMPNYILTEERTCKPCTEGYSKGGHQSICSPCSDFIVNSEMIMIQNIDPMVETCPIKCKDPMKFGANCELDQDLYIENKLIPIDDAQANFVNNTWSLKCLDETFDVSSGTCINTLQEYLAIQDNCAILTDCMNCSMSQSCSWCGGSCKNIRYCSNTSQMKVDLIDDFLTPALQCNMSQVCGPEAAQTIEGVFTFTEESVYKNQVCKWYVEPQLNEQKIISVTIRNKRETKELWDNFPNIFMYYCVHRRDSAVLCTISRLPSIPLYSRRFTVSNAIFYTWMEESMFGNAQSFEFEYDMAVIPGFITEIMEFIAILTRLVFTCALFMCLVNSYQKFVYYNRRRRILREIGNLELFRFAEEDEREASTLNVEEVMQDNRIVTRLTYDPSSQDYDQTECSICLDSFHDQEHLAKLCCKHIFHIACFQDWVRSIATNNQVKCPVCNRVLV